MVMEAWLQRFMYGRYGQDNLNSFLSIFALILCVISILTQWTILNSLALVLLFFSIFRMFSRNAEKRGQENMAFLCIKGKVTGFFSRIKIQMKQRKTHRFYNCPSCKQQLRVPKGKGRVRIRCPKCHTSFEKKT
jgi:predicted membrane protein